MSNAFRKHEFGNRLLDLAFHLNATNFVLKVTILRDRIRLNLHTTNATSGGFSTAIHSRFADGERLDQPLSHRPPNIGPNLFSSGEL